ncbi:MAG TPA: ATP-binding protein [Thermoanaerobaculia bacterium]|nr:ATP-binding protein [Thermoanaerobaculia bacterium]
MSSEESRLQRRAKLSAFARDALHAHDVEEAKARALPHVIAACGADGGCMLRLTDDRLLVSHETELGALGVTIPLDSGVIYAEAVRLQEDVRRELTRADYDAAPHLEQHGMRFGMVVPVVLDDVRCALAVFTRGRELDADDVLSLHASGFVLAAASDRIAAERRLAQREAALRLVFDQMPAVVWITDEHLVFTMIRGGTLPCLTQRSIPNLGRTVGDVLGPKGASVAALMQRVLHGSTERYTYDYHGLVFDVRVEPLRDEQGAIRGTVAVGFDTTERHRAEEALRASREELRELAARINVIEENERRRIAREIHDDMGQRLTTLRFEVDLLRRELGGAGAARVAAIHQLLDETGDAVRRIASDLRPTLLDDFGLRAAIENELASLRRQTGIAGELVLPDREPPLHRNALTALYRIVQAALTNVARHAEASRVTIAMTIGNDAVRLEITDDGRGITASEAGQPGTHGLLGMRERALAFGGDLAVEPAAGGGTRLTVRLPLDPARAHD